MNTFLPSSKTRRFFAATIDSTLLSILIYFTIKYLYLLIIPILKVNETLVVPSIFAFFALVILAYYVIQYQLFKNTFGKQFLDIKVKNIDGTELTLFKFLFRYLLREVTNTFGAFGSLFALTNNANFAIYDLALKSNVYYLHRSKDEKISKFWNLGMSILYVLYIITTLGIFITQLLFSSMFQQNNYNSNVVVSVYPNLFWLDLVKYEKLDVSGTNLHIVYLYTGYNYKEGYIISEKDNFFDKIYKFSISGSCINNCNYTTTDIEKIRSEASKYNTDYKDFPVGANFGSGISLERVR